MQTIRSFKLWFLNGSQVGKYLLVLGMNKKRRANYHNLLVLPSTSKKQTCYSDDMYQVNQAVSLNSTLRRPKPRLAFNMIGSPLIPFPWENIRNCVIILGSFRNIHPLMCNILEFAELSEISIFTILNHFTTVVQVSKSHLPWKMMHVSAKIELETYGCNIVWIIQSVPLSKAVDSAWWVDRYDVSIPLCIPMLDTEYLEDPNHATL